MIETQALSDTGLLLRLEADPHVDPRCSCCQRPCGLIHDRSIRRVREHSLFDRQVWLEVAATSCGVTELRREVAGAQPSDRA